MASEQRKHNLLPLERIDFEFHLASDSGTPGPEPEPTPTSWCSPASCWPCLNAAHLSIAA